MLRLFSRANRTDRGATAVEYALMLVAILLVAAPAAHSLSR